MVARNYFYLIIVTCLERFLWFQVFQSNNNNNSMVVSNFFYLIIVPCLHSVLWLITRYQVILSI